MSQKRVRLRALAPFGLSILMLGTIAPGTAAASSLAVAAYGAQPDPVRVVPAGELSPDLLTVVPAPSVPVAKRATFGPAPVPAPTVAASVRVIALAEKHLGARYAYGATGPHAFDCSGLVYRVFEDAGLGRMIDSLRSASALYAHFKALHKTSTTDPQPGDLVIFGHGSHVGIYIGDEKVIHAMVTGVAITRVRAVIPAFTTYVHLGLTGIRLPLDGH